jgi:predicted TIM-barrel fold metal-dependent hydrolase
MPIISADSHVVEGPGVFAGLADKFGDEAPRVVSTDGRGDSIVIPARGKAGAVNVAVMALAATRLDTDKPLAREKGHKPGVGTIDDPEIQAYFTGGYSAMRPGLTDGARRGEDQDIDGVQVEFLYPGYFSMFSMRNVELMIALQKNYNDWLHDFCGASNGRLYGLAALPVQDPAAALAELERVIAMGYKGVIVPSNAPKGTRYCDEAYEPIWARAEEAGVPVSFHVGCASHNPSWVKEYATIDPIAMYGNTASLTQGTLIEFMCHGICERHPNLKIVVAEFNAGWIAYWLDRVDQAWKREYGRNPGSAKPQPVHEIWQRQFYATIEDDQAALRTRDMIGENTLMWGSDYPHTDSTWPCSSAVLDEMFENFPNEAKQKVIYENVKALYSL